jgi:hypothetical protein
MKFWNRDRETELQTILIAACLVFFYVGENYFLLLAGGVGGVLSGLITDTSYGRRWIARLQQFFGVKIENEGR